RFDAAFHLDGLGGTPTATIDGRASVNLKLSGSIGSSPDLPSIETEMNLGWTLPNAPTVSFSGVKLDIGQFLSGIVRPVFNTIQDVTAPLEPLLEVIDKPLPGISDISRSLGGGSVTILNLAKTAADLAGFGPEAAVIADIVNLVQEVDALTIPN